MQSNYSLKFKKFDIFVIAIAISLIVLSIIVTDLTFGSKNSNIENYSVNIYYQGENLEELTVNFKDIDDQIEIVLRKDNYEDLLGDMVILINKEKGIKVNEVTCPNKICYKQGWVKKVGYPITCLPNGVFVVINNKESEHDIILG